MTGMRFLFGTGGKNADARHIAGEKTEIAVTQPLLYTPQRGWGFVTEENRREQELLRLPVHRDLDRNAADGTFPSCSRRM